MTLQPIHHAEKFEGRKAAFEFDGLAFGRRLIRNKAHALGDEPMNSAAGQRGVFVDGKTHDEIADLIHPHQNYIHNSFVPYKQQDAMTFFRNALKVAATEEKSQFGTRWIAELFAGEDKRRLTCPNCSHVQVIYTPFLDVGLVAKPSPSLKVCRKTY